MIPFLGLVLIIVTFAVITSGGVLRFRNLVRISDQAFILMICSLGVAFVMSQGSLDLSQGSLLGLSAALAATTAWYSPILGLVVAIAIGIGVGLTNGFLVAQAKIPSFIVTISMLFILRGLTVYLTRGGAKPIPFSMYVLDKFWIRLSVFLVVALITIYLFKFTKFGKYCRAIGSGELASIYSGVPVKKMKILAYTLAGTLCGVGGFLNILKTGCADAGTGSFFEIDILTALVVGGMPLTGGSNAKIQSAIIGALIIAVLNNGFALLGVRAEIQATIKGLIFLTAVTLTFEREGALFIK